MMHITAEPLHFGCEKIIPEMRVNQSVQLSDVGLHAGSQALWHWCDSGEEFVAKSRRAVMFCR